MEIWSELQVSLKVDWKLVADNAWKMIVRFASTSAHFYLFVDVLWPKVNIWKQSPFIVMFF